MKQLIGVAAALLLAASASAQEWQVARENFAFVGTRLDILVDAEAPGTLRVIRGAPGSVRVASRAAQGFTAAGLGDRALTLTAAGPGPVDYLVSVPADVWIDVHLPGQATGRALTGREQSATFRWDEAAPAPEPVVEWVPPLEDGPSFTTYSRPRAPDTLRFPELDNVESVGIRLGDRRFAVAASRPLSVQEGSDRVLEIIPAAPPMELVITLPANTPNFNLVLGGQTAVVIDGQTVRTLCEPITRQWLSDGRRWLTFHPRNGRLECGSRPVPRHEG